MEVVAARSLHFAFDALALRVDAEVGEHPGRFGRILRGSLRSHLTMTDKRLQFSKRNSDAVERRVAIDEVDALPGDHDAAVRLHQPVQRGAAEDALLLAPVFDHHEF